MSRSVAWETVSVCPKRKAQPHRRSSRPRWAERTRGQPATELTMSAMTAKRLSVPPFPDVASNSLTTTPPRLPIKTSTPLAATTGQPRKHPTLDPRSPTERRQHVKVHAPRRHVMPTPAPLKLRKFGSPEPTYGVWCRCTRPDSANNCTLREPEPRSSTTRRRNANRPNHPWSPAASPAG